MHIGWRVLVVALALASFHAPGHAEGKPAPTMVQRHVNATLRSQDFRSTANRVTQLVEKHGGVVTNLSLDATNPNGSAYFRLPPAQLAAFLDELPQLGDLQNLNQSSSDNTRSYEDTLRRLRTFEKMSQLDTRKLFSGLDLSPEEQLSARAELETFIRDRINSYRSTLDQYQDYQRFVEVNLTFQQGPQGEKPPVPSANGGEAPPPDDEATWATPLLLPVYLLIGINLLGLVALSRKLKR